MSKFALLFHWATFVVCGLVLIAQYDRVERLLTRGSATEELWLTIWLFTGSLLASSFLSNGVFKPRPTKNGGGLLSLLKLTIQRKIKEEKQRLKSLD